MRCGQRTLYLKKKDPLGNGLHSRPIFERIGPNVDVLAEFAGKPALVQKAHILAAAFHPNSRRTTVHNIFLSLLQKIPIAPLSLDNATFRGNRKPVQVSSYVNCSSACERLPINGR